MAKNSKQYPGTKTFTYEMSPVEVIEMVTDYIDKVQHRLGKRYEACFLTPPQGEFTLKVRHKS
jgi:hypothetical protein